VVDRVVAEVWRTERRQRLLPARVYYVLGLGLYSSSSSEKARARLGQELLRALF